MCLSVNKYANSITSVLPVRALCYLQLIVVLKTFNGPIWTKQLICEALILEMDNIFALQQTLGIQYKGLKMPII